MTNEVFINKIYWRNAILHLEVSQAEFKDCYITNGYKKYRMKKNGLLLTLNLTNVSDQMVPEGKWGFQISIGNQIKMLRLSNSCNIDLDNLSRVFPYGLAFYSYIVQFEIRETQDGMELAMLTAFYMKNTKPKKRNYRIESRNIIVYLLKCGNHLSEKFIGLIFQIMLLIRKQKKNNILLMSEARSPISGNLKALDDRIHEICVRDFNVYYYFDKSLNRSKLTLMMKWISLCWKMSQCSFVFIDDYSPIFKFIETKGKIKLIQLWHAGVGFKAVGYARFGKQGSPYPYQSGHRKYDNVVVGSKKLIPIYSEVFGIPENKFLPYGLPRLDSYLDKSKISYFKKMFYDKYPQLMNKKIILFAPTYRGETQKKAYYPYDVIDVHTVKNLYDIGYVFCIKMHPFITEKYVITEDLKEMIFDLSLENDINSLFYVTDILITDYSSNIYEYALMKKPVIFFAFDYYEYKLVRGMQSDLNEISFGRIIKKFQELESCIKNEDFNMENIERYINDYHTLDGECASDKIIKNILNFSIDQKNKK